MQRMRLADVYDLAIVGSGSAAFAAAIAARDKGRSVVLVEAGTVGGTCVNVGCIPSKALLAAAEVRHIALGQRFAGITTSAEAADLARLVSAKDALVDGLRVAKYEELASAYGFPLIEGNARFVDGPALEVVAPDGSASRIQAQHYLVATGSKPNVPAIDGLTEAGYLTSTSMMDVDRLPSSLLVLGGGFVALELGQLFSHLGSHVTILARSRLASREELEVADVVRSVFESSGIRVIEGAEVRSVGRDAAGNAVVTASVAGTDSEFVAETLLVATGRLANTAALGLDAVGVEVDPTGAVLVDAEHRTSNPSIWAAGDCVSGASQFVYVAGAQGSMVVDNAFGGARRSLDYHHLPRVTFTVPNIAAVGLTEAEAISAGYSTDSRTLHLDQVPRAIVNRDTDGFAKIVSESTSGRVLGITVVGRNSGDAILAGVYAIEAGFTVDQLATLWCPYLTMAEAIKLTAQAFRRDVSRLSCCAV